MDRLQTWVINLDRAPDRLERISRQLQRLGLPFTRLPAVDARALTADQRAALDEPGYRRKHGMTPLPGELGCYLSHVRGDATVPGQRQAEFALILEDDVLLHDSLPAVLHGLMAARRALGHGQALGRALGHAACRTWRWRPGHRLAVMLSRCTGASAYLVNRRAAAGLSCDGLCCR